MTDEASRETGALRDMLREVGGRMLFQASSNPPTPRSDPVVIQCWVVHDVPLMISIRQNSGQWVAFGRFVAQDFPNSVGTIRKYLIAELERAKAGDEEVPG